MKILQRNIKPGKYSPTAHLLILPVSEPFCDCEAEMQEENGNKGSRERDRAKKKCRNVQMKG